MTQREKKHPPKIKKISLKKKIFDVERTKRKRKRQKEASVKRTNETKSYKPKEKKNE